MKISIEQQKSFMHRWSNMIDRCDNPSNNQYHNYGGRGIKVCKDWYDFFKYLSDLPEGYFKKSQLDRIDNDGNYEPKNVRWVTQKENCNNKTTNRPIEFKGVTKNLSQWAEIIGINPTTLDERLSKWSIEDALTKPKGSRLLNKNGKPIQYHGGKPKKGRYRKKYIYNGKAYNINELSELSGIHDKLLRKRINERGWSVDRAVETKVGKYV